MENLVRVAAAMHDQVDRRVYSFRVKVLPSNPPPPPSFPPPFMTLGYGGPAYIMFTCFLILVCVTALKNGGKVCPHYA